MSRPPRNTRAYFDLRAANYAQHAAVQTEAAQRLLDRLDGLRFEPQRIMEIGCADGHQCLAMHQRFPKARVIGLDASIGMLRQARRHRRWWRRRFELLCADARDLPLAESSIDLVYANLSLSWLDDWPAALQEWRRVLRSDGLLLASVYGPETLATWRQQAGLSTSRLPLADVQSFGAALVQAGFSEPVLDTDWISSVHANPRALLAELRGACLLPAVNSGLNPHSGRQALQSILEKSESECRADWEIVSASAWAPEPGRAIRHQHGEEASVPISSIGIRRRDAQPDDQPSG